LAIIIKLSGTVKDLGKILGQPQLYLSPFFVAVFRSIKKGKKDQGNFVEYSLWRWGSVGMKDSKAHVLTKTYVKMPFQLWPKIYYIFPHRSTISAAEYFLKELYLNLKKNRNKYISTNK
jgi:hypothetical protein